MGAGRRAGTGGGRRPGPTPTTRSSPSWASLSSPAVTHAALQRLPVTRRRPPVSQTPLLSISLLSPHICLFTLLIYERRSHCVALSSLELSGPRPLSPEPGIKGMCHHVGQVLALRPQSISPWWCPGQTTSVSPIPPHNLCPPRRAGPTGTPSHCPSGDHETSPFGAHSSDPENTPPPNLFCAFCLSNQGGHLRTREPGAPS